MQHALLEIEKERNKEMADKIIKFPFCNDCCASGESGAVDAVKKTHNCTSYCGRKLYDDALPAIKKYNASNDKVKDLEDAIKIRQQQEDTYKDFAEAS